MRQNLQRKLDARHRLPNRRLHILQKRRHRRHKCDTTHRQGRAKAVPGIPLLPINLTHAAPDHPKDGAITGADRGARVAKVAERDMIIGNDVLLPVVDNDMLPARQLHFSAEVGQLAGDNATGGVGLGAGLVDHLDGRELPELLSIFDDEALG